MSRLPLPTYFFALVVVRLGHRFLLVHERKHGQLFYLPAGRVEAGELLADAARRETLEETGVPIDLTGILRNDGTGFVKSAVPQQFVGCSAWSSGPRDVWFGGAASLALHFDGVSMLPVYVPTGNAEDLKGVWSSGPNNVWLAATSTLMNWDGHHWWRYPQLGGVAMWGSAASDVWLSGAGNTFHYDGTSWAQVLTAPSLAQYSSSYIWGLGPDDVWFIVGGSLLHYKK